MASEQGERPIKQVTIVGGTHGNELTGITCVQHWKQAPEKITRDSFSTQTVLGNPDAVKANKRYLDKDLNRCFSASVQADNTLKELREVARAEELIELLNDPTAPTDFVIDLHTTTTNMGVTLIFEQANWLTYTVMQHVANTVEDVYFMYEPQAAESNFLISRATQGLMIEVGPIAQNLMHAERYQQTVDATYAVLDALEQYNQFTPEQFDELKSKELTLPVYEVFELVPYPTDKAGKPTAMVHPALQNADYKHFPTGSPEFLFFSGEVQNYDGPDCYPLFVNEAAYYDQAMAYSRGQKKTLDFNRPPKFK